MPPTVPPIVRPSDVDMLLAEFQRLRRLPAAELAREQEGARQLFNLTRSDAARVRFAMALTAPGAADDARALDLLDPLGDRRNTPS